MQNDKKEGVTKLTKKQECKRSRRLYVKGTTFQEVWFKWGVEPMANWRTKNLFVRCNVKGEVNWDKAPVYFFEEIKDRLYTIIADYP